MVWPTVIEWSFGSLEVKDIVDANLKDVLRNVSIVFCESIGSNLARVVAGGRPRIISCAFTPVLL
jgi:hypothetical protein